MWNCWWSYWKCLYCITICRSEILAGHEHYTGANLDIGNMWCSWDADR